MKRIKICFIHWHLGIGGTETALLDLVTFLDKKKFDITVVTIYGGGELEEKFREVGVTVKSAFSDLDYYDSFFGKAWNYYNVKKRERILSKDGNRLLDVCFKNQFDLIISYHIYTQLWRVGLPKFGKTIKYVHNNASLQATYAQELNANKKLIPKFNKIICVSESAKDAFASKVGISDNIDICYNPINSNRVIEGSKEPIEMDFSVPSLCVISRLSKEKGVNRLIDIHKRLLNEGIYHRILMIGQGKEEQNMKEMIKNNNMIDSFLMLGAKSNPFPYLKKSRFLIIPSFSEGMPVVAMEALCLGIPIVSSFKPVTELFADEPCGIVTDFDNESLYHGIKKMLKDNDFYLKAKQAAERRSAFFDGHRMTERVEKIYLDVLNET